MPYVIVDKSSIRGVRQKLKELQLLRDMEKVRKLINGTYAVPILHFAQPAEDGNCSLSLNGVSYDIVENIDVLPSQSKKPYDVMVKAVEIYMKERNMWREELRREIPLSWVKYGDLILFGRNYFEDPVWKAMGDSLWQKVCKALKVNRLGRMSGIKPDGFRSPIVEIIYGNGSWVDVVDGHVRYTWDVKFCMFCPGNSTERFRVAEMNCQNETVVDMYAGIGYFTIPFLVHAKAEYVHACEWNPHAVEALRKNLNNNKVSSRCCIHFGDNREVCPQNVADRVYLGLIPTCQPGIETACKALKFHTGGVLHLHENVSSRQNVLKSTSPLEVPQEKASALPSDLLATPSGTDSVTTLKCELIENSQCQVCEDIQKNFLIGLDANTRSKFFRCDESNKFYYNCSFRMEGHKGIIYEWPSIEVMWKRKEWFCHAIHLSHIVCSILSCFHNNPWMVSVINLHHVKSYAPHIDHLVYDLKCSPVLLTL